MNWDDQPRLYIEHRLAKAIHGIDESWSWDPLGAFWAKKGEPIRRMDWELTWEDMWPLIVEHAISLIKMKGGYQAVCCEWDWIDLSQFDEINDCCIGDEVIQYGHKNPLRAAAICLIKKLESEK